MTTRPVFIPVYEEIEQEIRDRMLAAVDSKWRKLPGDFVYDTLAPSPPEIMQLQANQDSRLKNAFAIYAGDEWLDLKLEEIGLTRLAATPNKRSLNVTGDTGVIVPLGYIGTAVVLDDQGNPLQYSVDAAVNFTAPAQVKAVLLTCLTSGLVGNLSTGSQFLFLPPIPGIGAIVDMGTTVLGTDTESDQSAWDRYSFKVNNPDTGGNKSDLKRWAEEVAGVGRAKVIPIWAGSGTVKVVVVDTAFAVPSGTVVTNVQTYLDPGITGLGDGKAPANMLVTVAAATNLAINIVVGSVTWQPGAVNAESSAAFQLALTAYLKTLVFSVDPATSLNYPVVYQKISGLLINTVGIANFTGLTLNSATIDIAVGLTQTLTLGTVTGLA